MIPQIFNIGPIPINSFGLMIALAFMVAIYRLQKSFAVNGIAEELAEKYVLVAGFSGLIGARVWYIIRHYDQVSGDLKGAIFSGAGFVFYGGFIFSLVVVLFMRWRDGISLSSLADSIGPALALAYAIGRVGCQLSGDGDYGMATNSIFGMSYLRGVVPTPEGILAYPTPVFESIMSLLVVWILIRVETKDWWMTPYKRFSLYLILMSIERFLVEFLRIEGTVLGILSEAQVVAIVLGSVGTLLLLSGQKRVNKL